MKYLIFCLITVISLVLSSSSVKNEMPSQGYYPGEKIPEIAMTDCEGNLRSLHDYKGKKIVVSFWATYHAQSRADNVRLFNWLKENEKDVEFVSIAFDENKNVVQRTLQLDRVDISSQFYGIKGAGAEILNEMKLGNGFRNYLIDESGLIVATNITPDDLKKKL